MTNEVDLAKIGHAPVLSAAVGRGARNRPIDVAIVQRLLNNGLAEDVAVPFLAVDGQADQALDDVITAFQRKVMKSTKPDGRIDRIGRTLTKLRGLTSGSFLPPVFAQGEDTGLWAKINVETLLRLTEKQFATLDQAAKDGFRYLFQRMQFDAELYDLRWAAYMLATLKAETGIYQPIPEYKSLWSKKSGAGEYAEEVPVNDAAGKPLMAAPGVPLKARYYGRGYVQLTWAKNYRRLGQALGLGEALVINPDMALKPATAYDIASLGMRTGMFASDTAGKPMSLSRFIDGSQCNYRHARQIINGLDRADEIAGYAIAFEVLILLSTAGPPKGA